MKYAYEPAIVLSPDDGEPVQLDRPVILLRVHGPAGSERQAALVDSGADHCLLPYSLAQTLGIEVRPCLGPPSEGIGGAIGRQSYADVEFELDDFVRWHARVYFVESDTDEPMILLGFLGFLEFFTATFDGDFCTVALDPNNLMSQVKSP